MSKYHKNILVPYDDGEGAKKALDYAFELISFYPDAALHIIFVNECDKGHYCEKKQLEDGTARFSLDSKGVFLNRGQYVEITEEHLNMLLNNFRKVVEPLVTDVKNSVVIDMGFGMAPSGGIIQYAEDNNCDTIIMGCSEGGILKGFLGKVSYEVMRAAKTTTTIVK